MSQKKSKLAPPQTPPEVEVTPFARRLREGLFIVGVALSLYILLTLLTYYAKDPAWSHNTTHTDYIANAGGRVGAYLADIMLSLFGYVAYLFPVMLGYLMWSLCLQPKSEQGAYAPIQLLVLRAVGFFGVVGASAGLASLYVQPSVWHLPFNAGGIVGDLLGFGLFNVFNGIGTTLILMGTFLSSVTLFTGLSWLRVVDGIGKVTLAGGAACYRALDRAGKKLKAIRQSRQAQQLRERASSAATPKKAQQQKSPAPQIMRSEPKFKPVSAPPPVSNDPPPAIEISSPAKLAMVTERAKKASLGSSQGALPPLNLLDPATEGGGQSATNQELETMSRDVEKHLQDFGIQVKVVAVHPGPVVTRFELQLAAGMKVSKISGLAKDLARSMSVISVRVVEVIPGKPVIGLELPNAQRDTVRLHTILSSKAYHQARSPLALGLGKDIAGHAVVVDLAKMPHLLVAGTTGSGKSVGLNAMLLSLLYKATPKELRMILIDPKMLELSVYEGIPHLLTPVVTDMKDAANALRWSVCEMERRYRLMASLGVRNIAGFNVKVQEAAKKGTPILDPLYDASRDPVGSEGGPEALQPLPYIVVLVDEFADMMMVVGKKVEELIARLAQKARAAGIHLILATQRPSVDVITGLIKANIPTRIGFQVSSKIDSRTVLDQPGAEQLLGHGDMLYLAPGTGVPVRVHGAYVADDEVHRVVSDLKRRGEPEYLEDVIEGGSGQMLMPGGGADEGGDAEQDEWYDQAVAFITETRRVSISSIQRRFKIGYNRAARIVEAMEAAGVVSTMNNGGVREVLAPAPVGLE